MKTATPSAPPAADQSPNTAELDRSLASSLAWTGAAKWAVQIVKWGSTIVVARLLTPEDYGILGMATVFLGLITLISEFGIGETVLNMRDLSERQLKQINTVAVMFGVSMFALSCALAFPISWFYRAPQLPPVIMVLSTGFIIKSLRTVPWALLRRDLRFKYSALVGSVNGVVVALSMILFAWLGFRYWTLVIGGLIGSVLTTFFWLPREYRMGYAWPRWDSVREAMGFSSQIIVERVTWYLYSNADFLIAGRVLGKSALGAYTFAWTMGGMVPSKVTDLISHVSPAYFSAVQNDPAALRRYLLKLTRGVSLLTFPATLGLTIVAEDFVLFALGEQWRPAILPLRVLSVYMAVRSITPLLFKVLIATREARFVARNSLMLVFLLPPAFYFAGIRYGTVGLAAVWIFVHPLIAQRAWRLAFRKMEMPARQYLGAIWPALSGSLVMMLVVGTVEFLLPAGWAPGPRLGIEVAAGAATYTAFMFLFHRGEMADLERMLNRVRAGVRNRLRR